jgi:hypothetical protein
VLNKVLQNDSVDSEGTVDLNHNKSDRVPGGLTDVAAIGLGHTVRNKPKIKRQRSWKEDDSDSSGSFASEPLSALALKIRAVQAPSPEKPPGAMAEAQVEEIKVGATAERSPGKRRHRETQYDSHFSNSEECFPKIPKLTIRMRRDPASENGDVGGSSDSTYSGGYSNEPIYEVLNNGFPLRRKSHLKKKKKKKDRFFDKDINGRYQLTISGKTVQGGIATDCFYHKTSNQEDSGTCSPRLRRLRLKVGGDSIVDIDIPNKV